MTTSVTQWLKEQFIAVPDVKLATTHIDSSMVFQNHDANLMVHTWMGKQLHVYCLSSETKPRELKNILKNNSRDGIGTLFLVAHELLPDASTRDYKPDDWQVALFQLNDAWIYTYRPTEDGLALGQVHYAAIGRGEFFNIWHLLDFEIGNVSVRQREIREVVKGEWYVGDIASPSFKRRVNWERVNQRYHYRTRTTEEIPYTSNGTGSTNKTELERAYQVLQVHANASETETKRAFRRMAMQLHPDVSALPKVESERRFKQVKEAYETLKSHHGWS